VLSEPPFFALPDFADDESRYVLALRQVDVTRQAGALNTLPLALGQLIGAHLHAGELDQAAMLVVEVDAATGSAHPPYGAMALAG
jgi:hypothetical protein